MAGNTTDEIKDAFNAAASSDLAQNVRSYVVGEKKTKSEGNFSQLDSEESAQIDRMDKDKIAEFLRDRYKSNARTRRR